MLPKYIIALLIFKIEKKHFFRRARGTKDSIDEFFWNRNLLADLLNSDENLPSEWTLRIIHGYFDQRQLTYDDTSQLHITLISRRSVHRAGVRYLRRGVDSAGFVANFVETEMIISFYGHQVKKCQIYFKDISKCLHKTR